MPKATLIDSHCHLDFEAFDSDRQQVLRRATENNISDIIIPGTQINYWQRVRSLCAADESLHACYGLHPYWLEQHTEKDLIKLSDYIEKYKPVALGECGLDYRPQFSDRKNQLKFFDAQLHLAQEQNLPAVIHSVHATDDVIKTLKKHKNLTGMIHSFSGSPEQARQLTDLNFYISIGGSVTYQHAKKIRKTASDIPLASLLVETDAPDQADEQHHKERNEPAYLVNTVEAIAQLREESFAQIAQQTTINAKKLFKLKTI